MLRLLSCPSREYRFTVCSTLSFHGFFLIEFSLICDALFFSSLSVFLPNPSFYSMRLGKSVRGAAYSALLSSSIVSFRTYSPQKLSSSKKALVYVPRHSRTFLPLPPLPQLPPFYLVVVVVWDSSLCARSFFFVVVVGWWWRRDVLSRVHLMVAPNQTLSSFWLPSLLMLARACCHAILRIQT